MRILPLSFVVLLLASSVTNSQSRAVPANRGDRVVIKPRSITLVRRASLVDGFREKRTAKVTYPIISGLKDLQVLRRIRSTLQLKNIFGYSIAEYRDDRWLDEFGYEVNYNRNYILDLTFTQSGSGAYPDTHTKHFAINLKTGNVIKAADVFVSTKSQSLVALVNGKLQNELKQILEDLSESTGDPEDIRISKEAQGKLEFKLEHLDEFSIGPEGVTFLYDAGYPHAIQAFEPGGEYFFSYRELKPFIKPDGLLGQFVD